ncbi:MAG: hypothetical protein Q7S03_04215 [bacterium]|nr:hypothetical protein [bacterium]
MNTIWGGLFFLWLIVAIVSTFVLGGIVLVQPFVPILGDWLKTITLYDLIRSYGFGLSIVMSLIGIGIGIYREDIEDKHYHTTSLVFLLAGVIVLILLLIGRFLASS